MVPLKAGDTQQVQTLADRLLPFGQIADQRG
jgi:hypothetical protein